VLYGSCCIYTEFASHYCIDLSDWQLMKENNGQKEHSERHTRSHQMAAGGKHYRKVVSATMTGQRSARTSLFGQARQRLATKPNILAENMLSGVEEKGLTEEKLSHHAVDGTGSQGIYGLQGTASTLVQSPDVSDVGNRTPQRYSPSVSLRQSNRSPSSPGYAGAKFSEAPSPKVLPKPPNHWVDTSSSLISPLSCRSVSPCREMTDALKGLLKVQC